VVDRLGEIRGFLTDMDGTLVIGKAALPGAHDFLREVRRRDAPLLVLSNNSSDRRESFHGRLVAAGLEVALDEVLTSGDACCDHLLAETGHRRIFLLGTPALRSLFVERGLELAEVGEEAPAVVVAFDKTLTYAGLEHACLLLHDGADFFATHPDFTCITPRGLIPDAGAILAAIESVTHRQPIVIGKPEAPMVRAALGRLGTEAHETLLVGDQCDTDVPMGIDNGLYTVLVLSGETSESRAASVRPRPDLVLPGVAALAARLARLG